MVTVSVVSSPEQERAVDLLLKERDYQDGKWGKNSQTRAEWEKDIIKYLNHPMYDFETRMVKVAALAIAAVEAELRRNP